MAKEVALRGKLIAKNTDWAGYTTYVFENLEPLEPSLKYIMCTQFPNWDQAYISLGDVGFVSVRYVKEGVDTWFDGTNYIPYKNTGVHFLKFIPEGKPAEDVVLDLPDKRSKESLEIKFDE